MALRGPIYQCAPQLVELIMWPLGFCLTVGGATGWQANYVPIDQPDRKLDPLQFNKSNDAYVLRSDIAKRNIKESTPEAAKQTSENDA